MRRYAIIATRQSKDVQKDPTTTIGNLNHFLTRAGWTVNFIENGSSMFDVYESTVQKLDLTQSDQVILCHDDIEILLSEEVFNRILHHYLSDTRTGFVGVAGSAVITHVGSWFRCAQEHKAGGGVVYHGPSIEDMQPSAYGSQQKAVIMDGCFLASTGKVLNTINLKMPKDFIGNWDWYDGLYTFQAWKRGLTNVIAPILLRHESGGRYPKEYFEDLPKFITLFNDSIPAVAK